MDASRPTRTKSARVAASAAKAVLKLGDTRKTYQGTIKDASHGAFYAGVAKGFVSALEGLLLFLSRPQLRTNCSNAIVALSKTHTWQAAVVAALLVLFLRYQADDLNQLLWTFSRWARIVTVALTYLLENKLNATETMFFDALIATHPDFAAVVRAQRPVRPSSRERFDKFKRIAKMTALRVASTIVAYIVPGGKFIVIPIIKYLSMRPILGGPVAVAVAAIYVLPDTVLSYSHLDDLLMSCSEAIIDADDLGNETVAPFVKRLDSEKTREYFRERYRGYMSGMGFFYSALMQVPFLGIPLLLVAECGAAVMVADVVRRNIEKDARIPLLGEEELAREQPNFLRASLIQTSIEQS